MATQTFRLEPLIFRLPVHSHGEASPEFRLQGSPSPPVGVFVKDKFSFQILHFLTVNQAADS